MLDRRPVNASIKGTHEAHSEAGDDVLHQQQGLCPCPGGFGQGSFQQGLQAPDMVERPAGRGLEGVVQGLQLLVKAEREFGSFLTPSYDLEQIPEMITVLL